MLILTSRDFFHAEKDFKAEQTKLIVKGEDLKMKNDAASETSSEDPLDSSSDSDVQTDLEAGKYAATNKSLEMIRNAWPE